MKEGLENIVLGAQIAGRNIRFTYDFSLVREGDMAWAKEQAKNLNQAVADPNTRIGDVALHMGWLLMLRVKIGTQQMEKCLT